MYRPNFIILFYRSAKMIELKRIDITFTLSNNQVFISKLQMGLKKKKLWKLLFLWTVNLHNSAAFCRINSAELEQNILFKKRKELEPKYANPLQILSY